MHVARSHLAAAALAILVAGACKRDGSSAPTPGPLTPPAGGEFTLVVLPDTQNHVVDRQGTFARQIQWIADNATTHDIRYVLHEGDIVNWNKPGEWQRAAAAMQALDRARVPYALAAGNHDMGNLGSASDRSTLLAEYFPIHGPAREHSGLAGVFEPGKLENSYHLFTAGGVDWMIIVLEFGPRDAVLAWANELCQTHDQRRVIVLTHAYLNDDGTRQSRGDRFHPADKGMRANTDSINDGAEIWDKLIRHHRNIDLVFTGHIPGTARQKSRGDAGNVVHEILANYQEIEKRDRSGWLRIVRLAPAARRVDVWTYSPLKDEFWRDDANQFSIELDEH